MLIYLKNSYYLRLIFLFFNFDLGLPPPAMLLLFLFTFLFLVELYNEFIRCLTDGV